MRGEGLDTVKFAPQSHDFSVRAMHPSQLRLAEKMKTR